MEKIIKIISGLAALFVLLGAIASSPVFAKTIKQKDEAVKAKYQSARQQYLKEVDFYKSARQDFLDARTKYQQLKNAENKKALEYSAKNFLEKAVNSLIKRLEAVKSWVSNRQTLPESERQEIIAEIDKDIIWLNARLPKIQSASPEAIKEELKTVRDYWKIHRVRVKKITGQILAARINFLIGKGESFSTKVNAKIGELKTAGKDASRLEAWSADFNQKLALVKEKYEAAKIKFKAIKGEPGFDPVTELAEADKLFREGHQFINEANQYIRQAHVQLVQIAKDMKNAGQTITSP